MINYFIAAWGGPRRSCTGVVNFLKEHIDSLVKLNHGIKFVTVCYSEEPSQSQEFFQYIESLKKFQGKFTISLICRPNLGLSYGAFSDTYGIYRNLFDYYIFMEDDVMFIKDDFDKIMLDLMNKKDCDYLCALRRQAGLEDEHPGSSVGLIKQSALEKIWLENGQITHIRSPGYWSGHSQVTMGQAFTKLGLKIRDWTPEYGVYTWWGNFDYPLGGFEVEEAKGDKLYLPAQLIWNQT